MSAPVLAGALMDHSVVSVLGAPGTGGCSSSCSVGGAAPGSPGQGGHVASTKGDGFTESGTIPVVTSGPGYKFKGGTGHLAEPPGAGTTGTISGNFNSYPTPSSKGRCTGAAAGYCS
jgi:hypothetical protein